MKQKLQFFGWIMAAFLVTNSGYSQSVFINEIHYDNSGTDTGEAIEIAGPSGTLLDDYSLVLYNGSNGLVYKTINLSGTISSLQNGYGTNTITFPSNGIQNGGPDGIALVKGAQVLQFLSYEGVFEGIGGPADGMTSVGIGVSEPGTTPEGFSLQLKGEGANYSDFTWTDAAQNTFENLNNDQDFISPEPIVFINELHYDTVGADSAEGIEIAGTAGTDLAGYKLILYNGNGGAVYKTIELNGTIPDLQEGYGTLSFFVSGIQNGFPDGIVLSKGDEVLQFLSYEGVFLGVGGPADGLMSEDVNVSENGAVQGTSLQLGGIGFKYQDFSWQTSLANTFGEINSNQSFGGVIQPEPEIIEPENIAEVRASEVGTKVSITGVLTVSDHFGNTAYIQDETGGIAIFGDLVTEKGLYKIGDSVRVTGSRAEFRNNIQISDVESVEFLGVAVKPIVPKQITLSQLNDFPGQLVMITDVVFPKPGQLFFGNANYTVSDASGDASLFIDSDVASLVGKLQPETCSEAVGVVGRYNDLTQLIPRNQDDLPCALEYDPTFPGSDISKDLTFDAVSWNIEWFGDEKNSPAARNQNSDEIQKEAVKAVLLKLDADVISVNEISDEVLFAEMVSEMEGYDFLLSPATSYPDSPGGQKVGFIFKTETVSVNSSRPMLTSVHPFYNGGDESYLQDYPEPADRFYASGRLPFLMEASVKIGGQTKDVKLISLHARANGSSGAQARYDMRKYDVKVLKDSIDLYFPNDKVMIMGDYNDDVDFTVANVSTNVSTYVSYTEDSENYSVLTSVLSEAGFRSYVIGDYDDMIDHITVTNELKDNYLGGSAKVHYEFYNSNYTFTTSDHLPVSVRMVFYEEVSTGKNNPAMVQVCHNGNIKFVASQAVPALLEQGAIVGLCPDSLMDVKAYPNPAIFETTINITGFKNGRANLSVIDLSGNVVFSEKVEVREGSGKYILNLSKLMPGLYIVRIQNGFGQVDFVKVLKQ